MKDTITAQRPAPPTEEPLLMPMPAVSRLVGIGARTLWRWISAGQFPDADVKIGAKVRRWRRDTILNWIEEQSGKGAA
jgi:predicted DNA-binding transcriptional regulator AlpA